MAVGTHLGIPLGEYDKRIRTFIPWYDEMLDVTAAVMRFMHSAPSRDHSAPSRAGIRSPHIVDLGIGSGALAARCLAAAPRARITGIDNDSAILTMASARLGRRLTAVSADFESAALPACDAIVSAFALHHIATPRRKARLYRRCYSALPPGGMLVIADCELASDAAIAADDRAMWLAHLRRHYSPAKSRAYLRAWAHEDFYFTLNDEVALLNRASFATDVRWRRDSFAVIMATRTEFV